MLARWLALAGLSLGLAALALGGPGPFGRLLVDIGLPSPALALLPDPADRGVALHRAGRHAEAAEAFGHASQPYNRGVAEAWAGNHAAALAAWDAALLDRPNDRAAAANSTLVRAYFAGTGFDDFVPMRPRDRDGPTLAAEIGQGTGRAASSGDEATGSTTGFQMPEVAGSGLREVPRIFDAQYLKASERWLDTLPDEPGLYLRARLAAEQARREALGLALPPAEDPQ